MVRKRIIDEDEEILDQDDCQDESDVDTESDIDDNNDDQCFDSEILISDDDIDADIVIEINEDDLDIIKSDYGDDDIDEVKVDVPDEEIILSKHKLEGKHSLKYDSIFKGKKVDPVDEEEDVAGSDIYRKDIIEVDRSSDYYFESVDNEKYIRCKLVKEKVYKVLSENTSINFLNNRRKPSRSDFNHYYNLLKLNLQKESFTNIELFNELAVYFSDNLFNMFKLLDKKWRNIIIMELQDHIGRNTNSKEVANRNIYEGTEVEFEWFDPVEQNFITITGDVIEVDYFNSTFKINSYERVYDVDLSMITKILNNTKFKYNLNKLNNIDFL